MGEEAQVAGQAAGALPAQAFRFNGHGSEYFGIWIVNVLLTLVTLGFYSPWAKVRRMQYLYRSTEVAGSSFDFHGRPLAILIGRIVALVILLAYNYCVRLRSPLTLVVLAVVALVLPWLLRNSLRFRLYNTSWRGLRFSFHGSVGGAYVTFLLNYLIVIFTGSLGWPYFQQRLKRYQHGNSRFGQTPFRFLATAGQFYRVYGAIMLAVIGAIVVAGGVFVAAGLSLDVSALAPRAGQAKPDPRKLAAVVGVFYAVIIFMALVVGPLAHALLSNLIWNNTRLGEHRFQCKQSVWPLMGIYISNFVGVILTLGLFTPWAVVRMARYQVQAMSLLPASDLSEFVAGDTERPNAIGEETAALLDIDIAL